jgi:hypothetical protein
MKSIEQLEKLSSNPFYVMSEDESKVLEESRSQEEDRVSSVTEDNKKKESYSSGNATVKEIGKLDKHHGDPRAE